MEHDNPNHPPSSPLGQHVPWSTPIIPQQAINMDDLNQHLAASLNDGIEVFDTIQSTPTTWDPTPPVSSGQMELQGTPTGPESISDDIYKSQNDIVDGEDSRMASPVQYSDNDNRRDSSEPVCLGVKLGPSSQSSLRAAIVRAAEMEHGRSLKRLPEKTRRLIEETFRTNTGFDQGVTLPEEPETINVRSSSTPRASRARSKGRDHLRSSAWTHLTYESGCSEELAYFREAIPVPTNIAEFFGDIEKAIKCPMLAPPIDLLDMEVEGDKGDDVYGVGYSAGQKEDLATMIKTYEMRSLRIGSSIPANVQDFNDSMGTVLSALDAGLDDDLTTKGVTPSSWFRLSAALLAAMTRGVLRSGGPKVKGRVKLVTDEDHFRVAPGLGMPTTEGGRIVVMARHLAELFEQHEKGDNLPFVEYFNNLQKVTQKHIQRAVKLAAVEAYQESTGDAEKIREIVMDDMADQLINQLKDDPEAQAEVERKVRERMMKKLEEECIEDIDEWRTVYRKGLAAALRAEATGTDIPVLSHSQIVRECSEEIQAQADKKAAEIKESIIKEEVEKYLLLQETDNARALIRRKYLENIEETRREVRAEIASEKKNWAVAYRDSVQLTFLREKAALLGYQLFRKDEDEEREGRSSKRAAQEGKHSRSASRAEDVTPDIPVTLVIKPRNLDGSVTPQARKNKKKKGGRKLVIPKPFSTAGSEVSSAEDGMEEDPLPPPNFSVDASPAPAPVQPISVPTNVRASQQPYMPVRDPVTLPVGALYDDSLRGVSSSIHNPENTMEDDLPSPPTNIDVAAKNTVAVNAVPTVTLPALPAIPLLPGLAELLNALQTNITTAFSSQISTLTDRMDQQDIRITNITKPVGASKGKGVPKARDPPPHLPSTTAPGARPDAAVHSSVVAAPGAMPDAVTQTNPAPGEPMGPPVGPPPPAILARKNGPVPVPRNATRWASVVTSSTYAGQTTARAGAITNAGAVGRTVAGGRKAGGTPAYLTNTEITVMRGKGLKDPKNEEAIRGLTPTQIVQSVRSQMEKLTASPPALMCGRWSTKPGSLNFVYVFSGTVPFNIISQYRKALVEPLGCGDILPNRGWTFAQLRGVPTSDGGGVIHSPDTLLRELRLMPFFEDAIFCSMPHWQASVHTISTVSTSTVQIVYIDEDGSRTAAAKAHGVAMFGLRVGFFTTGNSPFKCLICGGPHNARSRDCPVRGGFKPPPLVGAVTQASDGGKEKTATTDALGFNVVEGGKAKRKRRGKKTTGESAGASVQEVIFLDSVASILDTFDAFRSLAAKASDENSHDDFNRALRELEQEWGFNTAELDGLVCIQTRYAVKNRLPLCVSQVKDAIAREVMKDTRNSITQIQAALKEFKDKWGGFSPMKYLMTTLKNNRFASDDEIKLFNEQRKSAGDKAREIQDMVVFVGNLAVSLYENNEVSRRLTENEAETLVILHNLHIQPSDGVGVGPRAATVIKEYFKHPLALFNATQARNNHA
ncbi:hypothetical protein BJY52DRAFT_1194512 [Lactarius psammicola]|nr:hypothetical protein BJY52DRAFT_1194512 [Lactarius psammicola]